MRIFLKKKLPLNRPLKILLVTNALILLAGAMLGPIYAIFVEEIGGDLLDASLTFAIFSLVSGITVFISGKFADKIKKRISILNSGYLIMGAGFLLYTAVDSVLSLFLVQIVVGLGGAIYSPVFDALYSKHLDEHKEATEWGTWESTYYFTTAAGAILGGFIVKNLGFDTLFVIMAFLCFLSAIYLWKDPARAL